MQDAEAVYSQYYKYKLVTHYLDMIVYYIQQNQKLKQLVFF